MESFITGAGTCQISDREAKEIPSPVTAFF
jgi:hypothetical protein